MTVDFTEIMEADIEERDMILAEQNAIDELIDLADALKESSFGPDDVEELIDLLEMTASHNPLSETAEYLKEQAWEFLR